MKIETSSENITHSDGDWLTIREVAAFLKKSVSAIHKQWPSWVTHGVRPVRYGGRERGRLLFARSEILRMLEQWRVTTDPRK